MQKVTLRGVEILEMKMDKAFKNIGSFPICMCQRAHGCWKTASDPP